MTEQLIYIAVMAVITYLIRVLPITVFRKEITSQWLTSFLYYVPYAVLAALTFPAIFTATGNVVTSTAGKTNIYLKYTKEYYRRKDIPNGVR